MKIILISANCVAIAIVLLCGFLYPSIDRWSYWSTGVFAFYLFLELLISHINLLDAAKIFAWILLAFSSIVVSGLLLPYKLGAGDWLLVLVALMLGFTVIVTLVIALAFKKGGIADVTPGGCRG